MASISHYEVTNRRTGKVRTYKTRAAASRASDKADNDYGAYICTTRAIWDDSTDSACV